MDFFACTVDGKALRGAFYKLEFVNGDEIEFVIEPAGDFFTVHAARSASARMLWMAQHQIRDINAQEAPMLMAKILETPQTIITWAPSRSA